MADSESRPLLESDLDADPLRQFAAWLEDARSTDMPLPEAMALATATPDGAPSARIVLLKGFDERGFVFCCGLESRKACELAANPRAALLFDWQPLRRQVRIEGRAARCGPDESAEQARARPRASQLSALASPQSEVVESRGELEARVAELSARYEGQELPLPEDWGCYRLEPETFEFWQHREDRLHDRLRFRRDAGGGWMLERLAP